MGATTETYAYAGDGVRLSASTGAAANQTTKSLWDRNFGLPQLAIERDGNNAFCATTATGSTCCARRPARRPTTTTPTGSVRRPT